MQSILVDFLIIGILSIPIGFFITAFFKGKLPAIGGGAYRNRVLFGDRNLNPGLLVGLRACIVGFLLGGVFALIVFVMYIQNEIMIDQYSNSILSIVIGIAIGMIWFKYALGYALGKSQ